MADDTIFDRILRKEIPSTVVFENDSVLAFKDINSEAPVHVIVIPKKKLVDLCDAKEASEIELGAFLKGVALTAAHLGLEDGGYRTVLNTGRDAQQSVAYLHAHILAGRSLGWPPG